MGDVFISYSHDTDEHSKEVLIFTNRLIEDGIDCVLDQFDTDPSEGWPRWMDNNIDSAEFVLMICTEIYYNRVMLKEKKWNGLGVKWEGNLVYNHFYINGTLCDKFIPVIFEKKCGIYIPNPFRGKTYYCVDSDQGYEDLYRRLTEQPKILKPNKGEKKILPPIGNTVNPKVKDESTTKVKTEKDTCQIELKIEDDFSSYSEEDKKRVLLFSH